MKIQIEKAKTEIFESKEHYLAFRQAWSSIFKRGLHKQKQPYCDDSILSAKWHVLYALLRERDVTEMVAPILNHNKLASGHRSKIYTALEHLAYVSNPTNEKHYGVERFKEQLKEFFGDTLTIEMVHKIHPHIKQLRL